MMTAKFITFEETLRKRKIGFCGKIKIVDNM